MSETTLAELIQLKVQIEVGLQTLFDVCAGRKRWVMCVPPSPDDPDLLVADGLAAGQKAADALSELLAAADRDRAVAEAAREYIAQWRRGTSAVESKRAYNRAWEALYKAVISDVAATDEEGGAP